MSGHATIDTAVEATRFGALDFLEKPVALQRLLGAVRTGLERGRLMRSLRAGGINLGHSAGGDRMAAPAAMATGLGQATSAGRVGAVGASHAASPLSQVGPVGQVGLGSQSDVAAGVSSVSLDQPLRDARDHFERVYFEYHLVRENHSMTRVADRAGLERTHLYRKLKQLGIDLTHRGGRRQGRAAPEGISASLSATESPPDDMESDLGERGEGTSASSSAASSTAPALAASAPDRTH